MAKRNEWQFEYPAGTVSQAASRKRDFHQARRAVWQNEFEEAKSLLLESGVEFREDLVSNYGGAGRVRAVLDNERLARCEECRAKIDEHGRKANEYDGYARALLQAERFDDQATVPLNVDDVIFFDLPGFLTGEKLREDGEDA